MQRHNGNKSSGEGRERRTGPHLSLSLSLSPSLLPNYTAPLNCALDLLNKEGNSSAVAKAALRREAPHLSAREQARVSEHEQSLDVGNKFPQGGVHNVCKQNFGIFDPSPLIQTGCLFIL